VCESVLVSVSSLGGASGGIYVGTDAAYSGLTTFTIRMSRSLGALTKHGNKSVTSKNDAKPPSSLVSFSILRVSFPRVHIAPMCVYSCANTTASNLGGSRGAPGILLEGPLAEVARNCLQKARIEAGEDKSHSSAKISSLEVTVRIAEMSSSTTGSERDGVSAII
jgi:hypothetical protein